VSTKKTIKCKIGRFNLKKRLKSLKRQVKVHNFNTAKTAGIIFNSPDEKSFEAIKQFLSFLSQYELKVIALGYIPSKKIPENFLMRKGVNFYCKTDLNWYYKPKNELVDQFIEQEFDILFDLSIKDYFTVNYVGSLSKAVFKIGKQSDNAYQDLTIDIKENKTVEYLIEQIKHYLNIINN
jgi:hypothetical protein